MTPCGLRLPSSARRDEKHDDMLARHPEHLAKKAFIQVDLCHGLPIATQLEWD